MAVELAARLIADFEDGVWGLGSSSATPSDGKLFVLHSRSPPPSASSGYLFAYTPLKTKTTLSTMVGAFPGAVPPLIGWAAARGEIGIEAWVLFAILFLWQFPHFLAIAWMYREDYSRAGILMLPVVEPDGRVTAQQIVVYTVMLLPVSVLPVALGISGKVYLYGAIVLGLLFLYSSLRAAISKSRQDARRLLLASVIYLPLLFILMVLNR